MLRIPGVLRRVTLALVLALLSGCSEPSGNFAAEGTLLPINGTELYVKRIGSGEPMIVIHGGPMLEHGYLLPHLRPLADGNELIFYDQRLSGRSAPRVDSAGVRIATFVEDIEAIRQSLDLGRIHLVGHSWGGLLAMRYAVAYQDNLRSLLLLNSMSASSEIWQEEERLLAQRLTVADSVERQAILESEAFQNQEPDAIAQLLRLSFRLQFHDTSRVNELQLYVPEDYADRSRQFGYMMSDLVGYDLHAVLAAVTAPTLILYGSDEPATELSGAMLGESLPNSELVVIEDAGHFPFIEQPAAFSAALRQFLSQHPGN